MKALKFFASFFAVSSAKLVCKEDTCDLCSHALQLNNLKNNNQRLAAECQQFLARKCCDAFGGHFHHGLTLSTSDRESVVPPPEPAMIESGLGFQNKTIWILLAVILAFVFLASVFEKVIIFTCSRRSGNKLCDKEHFI
ncbi:Oidioi.mRNA.OKI2018_I69.XSR.g13490.t1.cds [Oikopleura dioica]|uniref:Oidioi.mRNA.OKI2018_I69.XSR.g13490.t1.cds n=1 Tax=Oikopleura dioica TaxID=34765 RepID=A0ABN7SAW5_OIKDI|nr:Oidioi.mRNA.OKI2018_I69.XSR.g13490.t1.cds [Oikopleura dioica]